jgi:hypothetical protein
MKMPCRFRRDMHPIKRLGTSEDVARAALFKPSMFARGLLTPIPEISHV